MLPTPHPEPVTAPGLGDPRFAVGFSEHPVAAHAVGEAIGQVAERLGHRPEILVVFVSTDHLAHFEAITTAMRAALQPDIVLATTASGVIAGGREAERGPAVSVWAATGVPATAHHIEVLAASAGTLVLGTESLADASGTLLVINDPFSLPGERLLEHLVDIAPDLAVTGGSASGGTQPRGNRLAINGDVHTSGAVALHFPTGTALDTVVSQGCRPVGEPLIVTGAVGNHIHELAGRPAIERFQETVDNAEPHDRALLHQGARIGSLQVGIVFDESDVEFGPGDFLIRGVIGTDPSTGAIAINDLVQIGTTVQFQVRDPESAETELLHLLARNPSASVLSFNCIARGTALFMAPNHDVEVIEDMLGSPQVAGMFCSGEFGPVRGRNHLHTFTNSLVLFD